MEPRQFAQHLQARRLRELAEDLKKYPRERLEALETMLIEDEGWLSVEEISTSLKVSSETVRRWIRSDQLKAYRAGRKLRIKPSDLKAFLNRKEEPQ